MPQPGFVYFARMGDSLIKVGMFAGHLTIADKERQYRTIDPNFKVKHAYYSEDARKEEQRVLSILRLVAGTEYKGAGKEVFEGISVKKAIAVASGTSPKKMEELARKAINSHVVDEKGTTVRMLVDEHSRTFTRMSGAGAAYEDSLRLSAISTSLHKLGIQVAFADPEDDLDVSCYGHVYDEKLIIKAIPSIKVLQSILPGLTF